jgi:hypothetical protein
VDEAMWDRWARGMGVVFVVFALVGFSIFGTQPQVGDSAEKVASFYRDHSGRELFGLTLFGFGVIALIWFVSAVANVLRTAGQGRLAGAAVLATAAFIGIEFVSLATSSALAVSVADSADATVTQSINTLSLTADCLAAFPLAAAILAGSVGLTRVGVVPSWFLFFGLAAALLIVLHGTNWASDGFWAPGGGYVYVTVISASLWTLVASVMLYLSREPAAAPGRAASAAM